MPAITPPELIHIATMTAKLDRESVLIPNGPQGTRLIVSVGDIEVTGDRITAQAVGNNAADWLTLGPDGSYAALDVRVTLKTDDDAHIYCEYKGRMDTATQRVISTPLFQTGDERYDWLNKIQCIGDGSVNEDSTLLTYELYEVRSV